MAKAFPPVTGGIETYSMEVARAYARAGYHVTVVTSDGVRRGWTSVPVGESSIRVWSAGSTAQPVVALLATLRLLWSRRLRRGSVSRMQQVGGSRSRCFSCGRACPA